MLNIPRNSSDSSIQPSPRRDRDGYIIVAQDKRKNRPQKMQQQIDLWEILEDLVTVLSSSEPTEKPVVRKYEKIIRNLQTMRLKPGYSEVLLQLLDLHMQAVHRDITHPDVEGLIEETSPSNRIMNEQLMINDRWYFLIGEEFRYKKFFPEFADASRDLAIDHDSLVKFVFGHDRRVRQHGLGIIYQLDIGNKLYIGYCGGTNCIANEATVARKFAHHVSSAFFSLNRLRSANESDEFELEQQFRITPVTQWKGQILRVYMDISNEKLRDLSRTYIHKVNTIWPNGLNSYDSMISSAENSDENNNMVLSLGNTDENDTSGSKLEENIQSMLDTLSLDELSHVSKYIAQRLSPRSTTQQHSPIHYGEEGYTTGRRSRSSSPSKTKRTFNF